MKIKINQYSQFKVNYSFFINNILDNFNNSIRIQKVSVFNLNETRLIKSISNNLISLIGKLSANIKSNQVFDITIMKKMDDETVFLYRSLNLLNDFC